MMFDETQYFSSWVYLLIAGVLVFLLGAVALFFRLETTVSGEDLRVQFGWLPVFQKRLPLRDTAGAGATRPGWGPGLHGERRCRGLSDHARREALSDWLRTGRGTSSSPAQRGIAG